MSRPRGPAHWFLYEGQVLCVKQLAAIWKQSMTWSRCRAFKTLPRASAP